ncbi:hypothetical protein NEDG_01842 [Nematocida displodere]|uniref:Uncharacterized protein n=1 Tax=Nematocida displodere TaxID=1805483 RepID=A0A177EHB2_9MICR|nr:hypothetical protein NEDG_01842 [Nematocida displodere]
MQAQTKGGIKNRVATLAIGSVILLSVISNVPREENKCPAILKTVVDYAFGICSHTNEVIGTVSILGLAFLVGSSMLKGVLVLVLLLNSENLPLLLSHDSFVVLLSTVIHATDMWWLSVFLPSLSPLAYGSVLCVCLKKRSLLPLALAFALACTLYSIPEIQKDDTPLMSSDVLYLNSKGLMVSPGSGVYHQSEDGKYGSGSQTLFGVGEKHGWRVVVDELGGNPPPSVVLTSGQVVHLQHLGTQCFLQTFDVASPLTITNQEVSCVPGTNPNTKFMLVSRSGAPSLGKSILADESFFVKHLETGVFVTMLKRRREEGFEVNGEKETGKDVFRGPVGSLWRSVPPKKTSFRALIQGTSATRILARVQKYLKIMGTGPANGYISRISTLFMTFFAMACFRALSNAQVRVEILSHLFDFAIAYLFRGSKTWLFCSAGITGLRHGLDLHEVAASLWKKPFY